MYDRNDDKKMKTIIKRDKIFVNNKSEYMFLHRSIKEIMPLFDGIKFPALYVITYNNNGTVQSGFRMMHNINNGYMTIEEYAKKILESQGV